MSQHTKNSTSFPILLSDDHKHRFPGNLCDYPSELDGGQMSQQEWKSFVGQIIKAYQPVKEATQKECFSTAFLYVGMLARMLVIPLIIGTYVNNKFQAASQKAYEEFNQNFKKILADHSTFYESRGISFSEETEEYRYRAEDDEKYTGTRRYLVVTVTVLTHSKKY